MSDKHLSQNLYLADLMIPTAVPSSPPSTSNATATSCRSVRSPDDIVSLSTSFSGPTAPGFHLVQPSNNEKQDVCKIMEAVVKVKQEKEEEKVVIV